jgi:hypothetical protein
MKRFGLVAVAIGALLAAVLAAPGASAVPAGQRAQSAATVQVNVSPLGHNGELAPGYVDVRTLVRANCYTGSDLFPGTYRCILGSNLFDPCWPRIDAGGDYHGAYCVALPWQHFGLVLRGRHVALQHRTGRRLWGLHTTDGFGCSISGGSHSMFHGQPVLWDCDHGRRFLLAMPDRSTAQWHITEVSYRNGRFTDAHRVGITKAWFAVSPFGLH